MKNPHTNPEAPFDFGAEDAFVGILGIEYIGDLETGY